MIYKTLSLYQAVGYNFDTHYVWTISQISGLSVTKNLKAEDECQ